MLIGRPDETGKIHFESVPDLPSDFTCPEWHAYNAAVDAAGGCDLDDQEQRRTYAIYHAKMQARYDAGDYEDIGADEDEEEEVSEPVNTRRGGLLGWLF